MDSSAIKELVKRQRRFFTSRRTLDVEFRRQQLEKLLEGMKKNQEEFFAALKSDLGKPEMESLTSETGGVMEEARYALKHLDEWAQPRRVSTPLIVKPGKAQIYPEPKGVVLIMSPWNYPVSLALNPLVGALAAGNTVILKPSELAPATASALRELIEECFEPELVTCVEGDVQVATDLLKERFDHIFFTGSTAVGKKVMSAAAAHLTPVTLELGGKSPCIVDTSASLDVAVKRIVWGKFFNAGQTCVAPDYVLVHEDIHDLFLQKIKDRMLEELGANPATSPDYGRIVNERHFDRLVNLMGDGKLLCGGSFKKEDRYIAPTILTEVELESPIMKEEIFGPILPIISYSTFETMREIIGDRADPLALYLFAEDKAVQDRVLREIPAGGVCINDTIVHLACMELPFGGRGDSGMGAYHGRASFDVFTHFKSVLHRSTLIDPNVRYRPYAKRMAAAKWLMG